MKILLTGAFGYTQEEIQAIRSLGFEVDFLQYEKDEIESPASYDAVVCNGLFLHHNIADFENLKYIQLTSAGYDRVDMDYIAAHGIEIKNARGVYSVPMAEWAILKILEIYKDSKGFYEKQKNKSWDKNRNVFELSGKTALIIGCGNIGSEIAKRLLPFGVKVCGLDILSFESEYFSQIDTFENIAVCLSEADIVILTAPATEQTYHMINEATLSCMKDSSVLVNLSRGSLVNEQELAKALSSGRLLGAALDVFEAEPLSEESPLWTLDNVIITPHNSFVGEGNHDRMFDVILNNLKDWTK